MKDQTKKVVIPDGHKKPVTRRDFLSHGLLSFAGYMTAPSIVQLLASDQAWAQSPSQCLSAAGSTLPAYVNVNLSGGAALMGNYVALDQGRQMYIDYSIMGMGMNPTTVTEFGNVKFLGATGNQAISPFLAGIRAGAQATTLANTAFIAIAHSSQDDSNINKIDASGLVTSAGLQGTMLPKLGRRETPTGTNNDYAMIRPPAPLVVNSLNDLTGALGPSGTLRQRLTDPQRTSLLKLISNLTGEQAMKVASPSSASGTTLANLVSCATGKNLDLATAGAATVDPRQNASINTAWDLANNATLFGQNTNTRLAMSAMVYNSLNGNAGAIGFDLGGYDYHGSGRANQDNKDLEAGTVVGKILESAALLGKKVFIQVTSDGSVSAPPGSARGEGFVSDHGISGAAFIIAYDPAGRPATKNDQFGYQLGHFSKQMGASADDKIINGAEAAGIATFANYMKFAGSMDTFNRMLDRQYTAAQLDYVLRFA